MLKGFDQPRAVPRPPGVAESTRTAAHSKVPSLPTARRSPHVRKPRPAAPARVVKGEKVPQLNVITNFSKPHATSTGPPTTTTHQRDDSLQERRRKGRRNGGSQGRIDGIKSEASDRGLSPSDRELMIGISIPGPPSGRPRPPPKELKPTGPSPQPEIVITPADNVPANPLKPRFRGRAASSIYSRHPNGSITPQSAPPLPKNPHHSFSTSIDSSSRCTSWATDFSDDDTLQYSRPESRQSLRLAPKRRNSSDTLATKHRSRGWWNQILSPFLDRPDLPKEFVLPGGKDDSPEDARGGNWKIEKTSEKTLGRVDSIWTDLTGHYAQQDEKFFLDIKDLTFNEYPGVHRGAIVESPATYNGSNHEDALMDDAGHLRDREMEIAGTQDLGLAVEYYVACWHDANNSKPYFQCENHVCAYGRGLLNPGGALATATGGIGEIEKSFEGSRNISEMEPDSQMSTNQQKAPSGIKGRPLSDATIIEEEETVQSTKDMTSNARQNATGFASPCSPEAMTPGLRTACARKQALPLRSHPSKSKLGGEPQPRYPSVDENVSNRREMKPPQPSAFSPVPPLPSNRAQSDFKAASPPPALPESSKTTTRGLGTGGRLARHEEINDTHTWVFPPPPHPNRAPATNASKKGKENGDEAQFKMKKPGFLKRAFGKSAGTKQERKKRRRLFCCILTALLLLVILIVVLVVEITLPRSDMSSQVSWLNLTGYPPIPTGIATIVRPAESEVSGCVAPPTMWSCALPKEQQQSIAPNPPDQPNFRVEIRFENGTNLTSGTNHSKRSEMGDQRGSALQRSFRRVLRLRDSFTSGLFTPSPAPPSNEDQNFLGNTTDLNHAPFGGEPTPFFMSILDPDPVGSASSGSNPSTTRRLRVRQSGSTNGSSSNTSDPFPDLANDIPPPSINPDGTAAAANLYPFPTAQPLMLYNRGLQSEHYGFYTYFDRSIFLKSASVANLSTIGVVPDDENGGSTEAEASLRCTWAQTRFLVQIWTNSDGNLPLLGSKGAGSSNSSNGNSSANDFTPPGSFPYPVSITLDRHGGNLNDKSIYCYGVNDREQIVMNEKQFQLENRSFDGHLVNPALGLFNHINVSIADGGPGGIDGGTGGCSCLWRNFQ